MKAIADRVAGAPISWGVCEVPGWGRQLDPATVLSQMVEVGLVATELGPDAFLPEDPQARAKVLADKGLRAVGGFLPVVLHDPARNPVREIERVLTAFADVGADSLVLGAATGTDGYDVQPVLGHDGWAVLLGNLDRLDLAASRRGITATLHPHVGTMVESAQDVGRVLNGSGIGLCLDTGHLLIGGTDPVAFAAEHAGRIRHTHLKDVDATWARRVRLGEVTYTDAVRQGMYRPLGQGDVDIAAILGSLERAGYAGWYVLEQDTILAEPPATGDHAAGGHAAGGHAAGGPAAGGHAPGGHGPMADVRASIEHLRAIARDLS